MAKPKVNAELCIGCGNCAQECPEAFEMKDDGKAHTTGKECGSCNCQEIIENCPRKAISMEE